MTGNDRVEFAYGEMWKESLVAATKDTPNIRAKLAEFMQVKLNDPLAPFGSSDKSFAATGIYKQLMPKARKAHLTQDISIIYELSGKNPTIITLYGIFTHAQLGTGQPPNIKRQKQMAKKLANS